MHLTLHMTPIQRDYYKTHNITEDTIYNEALQELTLILQDLVEDPTTLDTLYINPTLTIPIKVTKPKYNHYTVTVLDKR